MVQDAKSWLSGQLNGNKANLKKILATGEVPVDNTTEIVNPGGDFLTGELTIEGYENLTEIDLRNNKLTNLIVRNCPKLTKIAVNKNKELKLLKFDEAKLDSNGNAVGNVLEELRCLDCTELEELSLKKCEKLSQLCAQNCTKLKKIKGIEEVTSIDVLDLTGTPHVRIIHADKLDGYMEAKGVIKDILGTMPIPKKPGTTEVDTAALKDQLITKSSENPDSPAKKALDAIKSALELALTATKDDIIDAIEKLKGSGSNDYISKPSLVSTAESSLKGLGFSEGEIEKITTAASAREVEDSRNKLVGNRFSELQSKLKTSHY
jgi:hypothetical protein